jgi:hypothetical protein
MQIQLKINSNNIEELTKVIKYVNTETQLDWDYIWETISGNPEDICFKSFIYKFILDINFQKLSSNKFIRWNKDFINSYSDFLDFSLLSDNYSIPFDSELILKYKERWKWKAEGVFSSKYADYHLGGLSYNPRLSIDNILIAHVVDKIDFRALGMNSSFVIFNPNTIPDDYWPCGLEKLRMHIIVLMDFWDKWFFEGSVWVDGNLGIRGMKKDSIYDNKKIDWKFINEIKPYYKTYIINWVKPSSICADDDNDIPF